MTWSVSGATRSGTSSPADPGWVARGRAGAAALAQRVACTLLAPECLVCRQPLPTLTAGPVCPACWHTLPPADAVQCPVCGVPLASARTGGRCGGCLHATTAIAALRACGPYARTLRTLVHHMKYDGYASIAVRLGGIACERSRGLLEGADFVVPVPLHPLRRLRRGFNQSELIARQLGVPVLRALRRRRWTRSQTRLAAPGRQRNVDHAFALAWRPWVRVPGLVRHRVLVLVDDVRTTGATLEACARVLREAGAAEVRALVVARADLPRRRGPAGR